MMDATRVVTVLLLFTASSATVSAQFDSGSDGSDGAINITSNTVLDLPPDGIFNATTITVASGATLSFNRNAANTPVYLLATGDIAVEGFIDVSGDSGTPGRGGPGGFDAGRGSIQEGQLGGSGKGPGGGLPAPDAASRGGDASYIFRARTGDANDAVDGATYGSPLLVPLVGGSGGGGFSNGEDPQSGGGGGAVLLASNTRVVVTGQIRALGASGAFGFSSGSGGAVRIVAPIVTGGGVLSVGSVGNGGSGAARVDAIDTAQVDLGFSPTTADVGTVGTFMVVFLPVPPRLDIVHVAGTDIPEGTSGPIEILLPFDSPTNRPITVQGRGFTGVVPIRVALTPDFGNPVFVDGEIDMTTDPSSVTINAEFPTNVAVRVNAWTREP